MLKCEYCGNEHDGTYGSGRFCCRACACGYSTRDKRNEINRRLSEKLKGKRPSHLVGFKKGYDSRRHAFTSDDLKKAVEICKERREKLYADMRFEDLSLGKKREVVLKEQNYCCKLCGINSWNNLPVVLELDHIDGDGANNKRKNLRALCLNCHSQTETFRGKNIRSAKKLSNKV